MIVQAEPSQCSASARLASLRPTAQAFPPPRFATPNRIDFEPPVVAGVAAMVQLVPSQCAASGSVWANPVWLIEPTAQTSFAAAAETAFSRSWYGTEIRLKRAARALPVAGYWIPARTDVMRWVLKPSQCIRPT
jgi:hypothetical protein